LDIVGENDVSLNEITEQCLFTDIKRIVINPTGFMYLFKKINLETWLAIFEECSSNSKY